MYSKRRKARLLEVEINDFTLSEWRVIKQEFGYKCAYCGQSNIKLEQEHIKPLSKGGDNTARNIIPSCRQCNQSKYNKDFFDWYPTHEHYSKEREQFILEYLGHENIK